MEKVKLSDLITLYKKKCSQKDEFFENYFQEIDIEEKLLRLEMMYKVLGDVVMPLDYFKIILYAGHWHADKNCYKLIETQLKDIYDIISKYDDMPVQIIHELFVHYDESCFRNYAVKEFVHYLIKKYHYSKKTTDSYYEFIMGHKKLLEEFYAEERKKMDTLKDQYPNDFIYCLKDIMQKKQLTFNDVIKILPSNDLFKATSKQSTEFWAKYNDYRFVFELLNGKIDLEHYKDDDHIVAFKEIGQSEKGIVIRDMFTSFTKKEYLESLKELKGKALIKK